MDRISWQIPIQTTSFSAVVIDFNFFQIFPLIFI